jgi:hypothetical protein
MTPLILAAALSLAALDATPANAPPTPVAPAVVSAPKADDSSDLDKVICKKEEITGSRFTKRVCMTRSAWDDQQRRTEDFERRLGETPTAHSGGGLSGQ